MLTNTLSIPVWLLAAQVTFGAVVAAYLHEGTHAGAARLLGGEVLEVDLIGLEVQWSMPAGASTFRDRVINLAPQIVGCVVALAAWRFGVLPAWGVESFHVYLAWFVYTLHGGLADFSLAVAHSDEELLPKHWKQLCGAGAINILGMALFNLRPLAEVAPKVSTTMTGVYYGLLIAPLVLFGMSLNTWRAKHGLEAVALPGW